MMRKSFKKVISWPGAFIQKRPYASLTTGVKIRRMILPVHTGSILGWPTKTVALITALFTASFPITGILIWLRKGNKAKRN